MKATLLLIITCIFAFPLGFRYPGLFEYSYNNLVLRHEWWTPLTALFIHGSLGHLLGNMLFLLLFGNALERIIGPGRLIFAFFAGGAVSLLSAWFFYPANEPVVGASGAICTIIGLLMIFNPWKISFLLNFFPMPMGVAALTYMLVNFFMAWSSRHDPSPTGAHTAYELHIIGFIAGIILGTFWNPDWKKNLLISILSFVIFYIILGLVYFYFR